MGNFLTKDGLSLYYDEYGSGDRVILSAQAGFYPEGLQQVCQWGRFRLTHA